MQRARTIVCSLHICAVAKVLLLLHHNITAGESQYASFPGVG